ncbi:hypothetical protein ABZ816_21725 [Actinosynnema sp. NPDC047251]|uniref:Uncharacterized protein n=1 Tax=Saccharothrix espanaensis (strain ATCC 51144 / DSM 44229 / JCM 9112 / NBRC 15066 / NRRL 15764) TaxID=1179773 RepID=K0K648_SACES|nr:hypothetical protein [Saccharothrix espanaensis]CCH33776.1 hypothetical protein BN6_65350 [Saccharothrix espanaensis DSM 44229]
MADLSWPQRTALVLGALLVVWGLVDFVAGRTPLGLLHVITGAAVLVAAFRARAIRLVGTLMGLVFLVVFAYGLGDTGGAMDAGFLGNAAHLLLGFASVGIAESCVWCEQRTRGAVRRVERLP